MTAGIGSEPQPGANAPEERRVVDRRVRLLVAIVAAAVCAVGAGLVLSGTSSPARPYVVLVGLVVGSGWGVTGWLRLPPDPAYIGSVVLAAGVAIPIALSIILVESNWWHPVGASGVLLATAAGINIVLAGHAAVGRRRLAGDTT